MKNAKFSTLLYCLGDESDTILASLDNTSDVGEGGEGEGGEGEGEALPAPTYKSVIEKFETFFKVRKNVIFERA